MAFHINETSQRFIGSTRDNENRTIKDVSRTFQILSDTPSNQFAAEAALAAQFGVFSGAPHPLNQFYFCERVHAEQITPIYFEANAEYRSPAFREGENPTADPVLERPRIRISAIETQEPTDTDRHGDPIATETGELYQGVTKRVSDLVLTVERNYAIFDEDVFQNTYLNTTNSDTFRNKAPGRCLVSWFDAEEIVSDFYSYWTVQVKIIVRKPIVTAAADVWKTRLRHEGFMTFVGANPKPVRAIDGNGEWVARPVPLDDNGFEQDVTDPPVFKLFDLTDGESVFANMNLGVN